MAFDRTSDNDSNPKPPSKLITPRVIHDQPLDQALAPEEKPEFYFDAYANTFARLIADRETRTPLVLGISGAWGSGKTTLLKLIQSKVEETGQREQNARYSFLGEDSEGDFRQCRTVWFNAWKYAEEDALLVALVRVIVQTMYADDVLVKSLAAILDPFPERRDVINTVLGWFSLKTPLGDARLSTGVPEKTTFAEKAALLDQFSPVFDRLAAAWVHRNPLATEIKPREGVLVVFVDDLDRCMHDKAVQVLEAIKLFLDRPGVVFVLAADEGMIEAAIEARFKNKKVKGQRARDYLEKFFQVRFVLPPISEEQAGKYLAGAISDVDEALLRMVLTVAEVNPRQIKTFVNYLNVGWAVLTNSGQASGVERADFARWLALTRVGGERFLTKLRQLPKESRLDYLADAVRWASDPAHKQAEYQDWAGPDFQRLRGVLRLGAFSSRVTTDVFNGFIFWSAPVEIPRGGEETAPASEMAGQAKVTFTASGRAQLEPGPGPGKWVVIPAGKFVMGSRDDDKDADDVERPQHTIEIPYDYRIARYPVTNAEFRAFVQAKGRKTTAEVKGTSRARYKKTGKWQDVKGADWQHPEGPESNLEGRDEHPVVHISWEDARAYCDWLTQVLRADKTIAVGETVALPTETEWEKAARGEYGKVYPWGDEWDLERCNSAEKGPDTTTPVGQYSALGGDSPYGVADMAGNVWEWCQSRFVKYPYNAKDGREKLDGNDKRVLRGGSFSSARRSVRCAGRNRVGPDGRYDFIGFRVVVVSPGRAELLNL